MQNTRLNSLISQLLARFVGFVRNPWRRLSLLIIGFLGGNFLATIIATVAGQRASLDVQSALVLVLIVELINWLVYRNDQRPDRLPERPLLLELLNNAKIGLLYGLFVEAFKLGS
jgi:energy-coupling factor transporter transmembrane protein EcfT